MYYPYLRGRQYELIALREMLEHDLLDHVVIPIIEPVKASPTLLSTLQEFIQRKQNVILIQNPQEGSFLAELSRDEKYREKFESSQMSEYLQFAYIIEPKTAQLVNLAIEKETKNGWLICNNKDAIPFFKELQRHQNIDGFIVPEDRSFRRNITVNRVLIEDRFNKKNKNASYQDLDDEFFSDDHRFFPDDDYIGYSDFSIIGDEYVESGFAPYAVAIHMVYFDLEKNLRVHHFVSDTNEDINDPAGKFAEALTKLISFDELKADKTYGLGTFQKLFENKEYPGLGTVKKLTLMHHFELVAKFFKERQ